MTKKKEPQTDPVADLAEMKILRQLETTDRSLKRNEEQRAEAMHEFGETRKALEAIRDGLLNDLTEHRLGIRKLFDANEATAE